MDLDIHSQDCLLTKSFHIKTKRRNKLDFPQLNLRRKIFLILNVIMRKDQKSNFGVFMFFILNWQMKKEEKENLNILHLFLHDVISFFSTLT